MITFTELEVVLIIGWVVTVFAFMNLSKRLTTSYGVASAMDKLIQGIADKKVHVERDSDNNIHIKTLE
jgi:hypothetical protein